MLYAKVCAQFVLFSLLLFSSDTAAEREIHVSPSGNDSSSCTKDNPCRTPDKALSLASNLSSSQILLAKGNYSLKTGHNLTRISSFGLFGSSRDDVRITCDANVSISFALSENITFERVQFLKCGGWHSSSVRGKKFYPELDDAKFKTALDFRYCRNLVISDVIISSSPGCGANLYDVGGVVNFTNSLFVDNHPSITNETGEFISENSSYVYSGGGVAIFLNRYGYDINVTPSQHDSYQHNNSYVITNCQFHRNKALWANKIDENELNTAERPFSRGGGLAIYFQGNASGCTVAIHSCIFTGNEASWGGGVQVEMNDKTENNSFEMRDTEFEKNRAVLVGGGARLGNLPFKGLQLRLNRFEITNCTFTRNKAKWGGGAALYGTTIPRKCTVHTEPVVTQFFFIGCRWLRNIGNIGAAMGAFLHNENDDLIGPEIPYRIGFHNHTLFHSNEVILTEGNLTIGQGSLYSVEVPLVFRKNAQFENNSLSALVLDGATLELHERLDFINNSGIRGGGIAMYGRSRIIFYENSTLNFEGNTCDDKGGALYIQAPGSPLISFNATGTSIHACFFAYVNSSIDFVDDWNTSVIFNGNRASLGQSVYATTLENCRRAGESRQNNSVLRRWKFVKFINSWHQNNSLEIATDPVKISYLKKDWSVAPGEIFDATVKLLDEVMNSVPGVINVTISSSSVHVDNSRSSLFVTSGGKIKQISLTGQEGVMFSVELSHVGSNLLKRTIRNLTLTKCYPGFKPDKNDETCTCMKSTEVPGRGVSYCDTDRKTVFIKAGYWAGNVKHESNEFVTYFCPIGYCNKANSEYQYVNGQVCAKGRKQDSILCGECEDNYSITFGSEQCSDSCTNLHLFYGILIGLVLTVIVVVIMLVNLDFFTGYLNAWLYSYQVMKLLTPDGFEFDPFIEFFIALTNIRVHLGENNTGFCLAKHLDDVDKLMIMYAVPTFVIAVVVLLAKLVRMYPEWCFSQKVRYPVRAICTIFVLCYTDVTRISLKILDPAKIGSKTTVVFVNGGLDFFHGKHLWYSIFAIICITFFVIPFPLILLFRPFLTRGLRPVLNLNRWNPFFDAFQGCLKDEYRWCAAFYFLCRLGILVIHTYVPACPIKSLALQGICILVLVMFAFLRPYKEARDVNGAEKSYEWINKSDVVVLTTVSLIAVVSSPIDSYCETTVGEKKGLQIVVRILAYVPLLVVLTLAIRILRIYCSSETVEDDTLPVLSETSDTIASSHRASPVFSEISDTLQSPRGSQQSHRGSQQGSRGSQQSHRGSQQGSRGSQHSHRGSQEGNRESQHSHRGSQQGNRGSQQSHRGSQEGNRGSQQGSRGSQQSHRGSQGGDRGSQPI